MDVLSRLCNASAGEVENETALDAELVQIRAELLTPAARANFKTNFELEREEAIQNPKTFAKALLDYTSMLAISTDRSDNFEAIELLSNNKCDAEAFVLFRALAHYHLGQYRDARLACEHILMRKCPENTMAVEHLARTLLGKIRKQVYLYGWSGIGLIALVMVLASAAGSVMRRS